MIRFLCRFALLVLIPRVPRGQAASEIISFSSPGPGCRGAWTPRARRPPSPTSRCCRRISRRIWWTRPPSAVWFSRWWRSASGCTCHQTCGGDTESGAEIKPGSAETPRKRGREILIVKGEPPGAEVPTYGRERLTHAGVNFHRITE